MRLVKGKVTAIWLFILQWQQARSYWDHSDCWLPLSLPLSIFSTFLCHSNWPRQTRRTYEEHTESLLASRRVNNDGHVLQNVLLVCESTFFSLHFVHTHTHSHTHYVYVMSYKLSRHAACWLACNGSTMSHTPQSQKAQATNDSQGRGTWGGRRWVNAFYRCAQWVITYEMKRNDAR